MTISPRQWSSAGTDKLVDMAVNASLQDHFWFGRRNKALLTGFAKTLKDETGEDYTYEAVLLKLNDFYMHHVTWQWVIKQPGLTRDPKTQILVGTDEVWRRIVWEKPFAALYKFTSERFEIPMMMIFNYPLRVANCNNVHDHTNNGLKNIEDQEVIIISDSESDTMEIGGETGANNVTDLGNIQAAVMTKIGPAIGSTSSHGDTERCSTASSPFPPNIWRH